MAKINVTQYQGSPDLFNDKGVRLSEQDVKAMGGFGAINIQKQSTVRPGVTTEADFAKVAGTNLPSINTQQVPKQAPQVSLPQPTASRVQEDYITPLANQVQKDRQRLEAEQKRQLDENRVKQEATQKKMDELRAQTTSTLEEDVKPLMEPFRAELETSERERLSIDENFQKNQELTNELENLLTEGNQIIQEMKGVTGLAGIRNPRINKAIEDISARAGVIEAVMSARNGQINQAYTMIDRSVSAITADRNDQLNYYNTLIGLYESERDEEGNRLLRLEEGEIETIREQTALIEGDLKKSEAYVDNIKQMMLDPNTADFMARSGVKLTDSPEVVNKKMSDYSYTQSVVNLHNEMRANGAEWIPTPQDLAGIPENEIIKVTDSRGQVHQYRDTSGNELLSVAEAKALGVPYGTTKAQAKGIMPKESGSGGGGTVVSNPVNSVGGLNLVDANGKPIKLTASQVDSFTGFENTIQAAADALELMETTSTGPLASKQLAAKKFFGLVDETSDQLKLEQLLGKMKADFFKAVSGAAVSEQEVKRLSKFLPDISDQEGVIRSKLATLANEMERSRGNLISTLGATNTSTGRTISPLVEKSLEEDIEVIGQTLGSRESLIEQLTIDYPEFDREQIAEKVYTLIKDK